MNTRSPGLWLRITRGEHAGAFYLLIVASLLGLIPLLLDHGKTATGITMMADSQQLARLTAAHRAVLDSLYQSSHPRRFYLRSATPEDFQSLGISEDHARHIWLKIRTGQRFRSLGELSRETGIDSGKLAELIHPGSFRSGQGASNKHFGTLELNAADSAALTALPGIGPKTAIRLLKFRNALGGFIRKDQILETWGVDTISLRKLLPSLTLDLSLVRKIAVNKVTEQQLAGHPYISARTARLIVAYRKQHPIRDEETFRKIKTLDPAETDKILPYIHFD